MIRSKVFLRVIFFFKFFSSNFHLFILSNSRIELKDKIKMKTVSKSRQNAYHRCARDYSQGGRISRSTGGGGGGSTLRANRHTQGRRRSESFPGKNTSIPPPPPRGRSVWEPPSWGGNASPPPVPQRLYRIPISPNLKELALRSFLHSTRLSPENGGRGKSEFSIFGR